MGPQFQNKAPNRGAKTAVCTIPYLDSPNNKEELILFLAKYFLFGSELTLWDSSCRDKTGIKGLLFYYIHI